MYGRPYGFRSLVIILRGGDSLGAAANFAARVHARKSRVPPQVISNLQSQLTPEMRGDILMARKMYREAIEAYTTADPNSPVIANKIGIAYHQMMDLDLARKQYERAIKLDPKYSEAINNLGTVYYASKNYRRAVSYYNER